MTEPVSPTLREKTQSETVTGILGQFQRMASWAGERPGRAALGLFITIVGLVFLVPIVLFALMPERSFDLIDGLLSNSVSERLERELGEEVDRLLERSISNLCRETGASRCVVRAYVYERNSVGQIIAITDVFEIMDPQTERTGIRGATLPIDDVDSSIAYMLTDPSRPRCIARDREEYESEGLRAFMERAGLKASVACPITGMDGTPLGLLSVSVRTPLERNPELVQRTRDRSLVFSGYWLQSPKVKAALERALLMTEENIS